MEIQKKSKKSDFSKFIILMVIVVIAGISGMFINEKQDVFSGSKVKNADCYILQFEKMSQTDSHEMELAAGDTMSVDFGLEKGSMSMTIGKENSEPIYEGNGGKTDSFKLTAPEDGTYEITVEARDAAGYVMIYSYEHK